MLAALGMLAGPGKLAPQNWTVVRAGVVVVEVGSVLRADGTVGPGKILGVPECFVRERFLPERLPKHDAAPDYDDDAAPGRGVVPGHGVVPPNRKTVLLIRVEQSFLVMRWDRSNSLAPHLGCSCGTEDKPDTKGKWTDELVAESESLVEGN